MVFYISIYIARIYKNINVNVIVHELKACITQHTISEEQMKYVMCVYIMIQKSS